MQTKLTHIIQTPPDDFANLAEQKRHIISKDSTKYSVDDTVLVEPSDANTREQLTFTIISIEREGVYGKKVLLGLYAEYTSPNADDLQGVEFK